MLYYVSLLKHLQGRIVVILGDFLDQKDTLQTLNIGITLNHYYHQYELPFIIVYVDAVLS